MRPGSVSRSALQCAWTMTKRMGRPTKLDEVAAEKIIQAVRAGAYRKVAAQWAGISQSTFRAWMTAGRDKPTSPHGTFRRKVIEAETAAEITVGTVAYQAAARDPDYALAYMRVRWRKRWDPAQKVELTGKGGKDLMPAADPIDLLDKLRKMELVGGPDSPEVASAKAR